MTWLITHVQELCEAIVFGNGWLAAAGLGAVCALVVALRLSRGIHV